jgi:two-component system cell cycle response regulator
MSHQDRYEEAVIKDNLFHRRLSDLRNSALTQEHLAAMAELNRPAERTMFSKPEEEKTILSHDDVERIAFYDDLAPVYNFKYFMRKLDREMRRSKRYNRPLSVLCVAFSGINNIGRNFSSIAQDNALYWVGEHLLTSTRMDVDMVGRFGDERFLVVLPETPGSGATIVAERMRKKFEDNFIQHQWHKIYLQASVGIAYFPGHGTGAQELVAKSDLAAEMVQTRGGNGTAFCPE